MRAMISVGTAAKKKFKPAIKLSPDGVIWESVGWGLRPVKKRIAVKQTIMRAALMAKKMRIRHPGRMPFGPRKIVHVGKGAAGAEDDDAISGSAILPLPF